MNSLWLKEFRGLGALLWIVPVSIASLVFQLLIVMLFPVWYYLAYLIDEE